MKHKLLLEVKECSKNFPGVKAFNKVNFNLYKGEVHCVVGENGAGKSTFIKMVSGALRPDEGSITVGGQEYSKLTPGLAHQLGIQTIYQEIVLASELTVAENIFMGNWPVNRLGLVNYAKMNIKAKKVLETLKIGELNVEAVAKDLSVSQKQSVQIAFAMVREAKVLILDEPTSSYNQTEINNLLKLVRKCADRGIGVIYISHHLEEVFSIHDRITVLRDGKKIATHGKNEVSEEHIIREMIGRDVSRFFSREKANIDYSKMIEFNNFSNCEAVNNVSFKIHKGEVVGFAGMVGSGRTELMRLIFGVDKKRSGRVVIEGKEVDIESPQKAIRSGFSLLTEDRQKNGFVLDHSIEWNTSIVNLMNSKGMFINERKEGMNVKKYVDILNIQTPDIKQIIKNLSGGNQQKVILAKWLYADTKLIIFDEPTKGIDIGAKEEIYKFMVHLAKQGKYILMISSEMSELIAMCDRVIIMRKGSIITEISQDNLNEENILNHSIGGVL